MAEILLTRIFSFTIWYHLAYLTISTALLGFGAAGAVLAAWPHLLNRARTLAAFSSAGAGLALLCTLAILAPRPIDPNKLLSEPAPFFAGLLGYYILVAVPFFLAGVAISAPLSAYPERANRLYAADLLGAGCGCALAVAALSWLEGPATVAVCAAVFLAAGSCYAPRPRATIALAIGGMAVASTAPVAHLALEFVPTGSKALGEALENPRLQMLYSRWSPINRVDLYRVGKGLRGGWWSIGVGKEFAGELPRTLSIQYDGHNGTDVYNSSKPSMLRMLDSHFLRTPYLLKEEPRVLVIGVGGGIDVQNAVRRGASRVTGVDLQPITVDLHHRLLNQWTGGVFQRRHVELVAAEGRHFVSSTDQTYDLIQLTGVDTFSAQTAGAYVLAESYLYTVEAIEDYFGRLAEDGMLSVVIGDLVPNDSNVPPPMITRLALVARTALERSGVEDPSEHVIVVAKRLPNPFALLDDDSSSSYIENLLVKKSPFEEAEIARVTDFAERNGFELLLSGGTSTSPGMARVVHAPPDQMEEILEREKFHLAPVTDEHPFFFNVLRWRNLAEGEQTFALFPGSATGQLVLIMMLGQALILGGALILPPLIRIRVRGVSPSLSSRYLLYFLGLGVGFLLIEISFVQKYILLLGYPTYSLSVTIFSLLVAAALGAYLSQFAWRGGARRVLLWLLATTATLVVAEVLLLPWIRSSLLSAPIGTRVLATAGLQFPLGVVLGMYFPTGVELLRRREPLLIPWAWAVNGVGSVVASVLAVLLAMAMGFSGVAFTAVGIYIVGTVALISTLEKS
jgi:hypothetical protein